MIVKVLVGRIFMGVGKVAFEALTLMGKESACKLLMYFLVCSNLQTI